MLRRAFIFSLICCLSGLSYAQPATDAGKKVQTAMSGEIRTDEERERDGNRKPIETLEFFGLTDDMSVIELLPGGGWYTKILAPVLAENGNLHIAMGADGVASKLTEWGLQDQVKVLQVKADITPTDQYGVYQVGGPLELPASNVDMVLTFRNVHNFDDASRAHLNSAAFAALKPGGIYGVVDHTRRHMEPGSSENWRRVDPVMMIKQAIDAGFEFVGFSDLHYRPDDELEYDTTRKVVQQNSDRFTLKFRKPE